MNPAQPLISTVNVLPAAAGERQRSPEAAAGLAHMPLDVVEAILGYLEVDDVQHLTQALYGSGLEHQPLLQPCVRHAQVWARTRAVATARLGVLPPPGAAQRQRQHMLEPCALLASVAATDMKWGAGLFFLSITTSTVLDSFPAYPQGSNAWLSATLGLFALSGWAASRERMPIDRFIRHQAPAMLQRQLWNMGRDGGKAHAASHLARHAACLLSPAQRLGLHARAAGYMAKACMMPLGAVALLGAGIGAFLATVCRLDPKCEAGPAHSALFQLFIVAATAYLLALSWRDLRRNQVFERLTPALCSAWQQGFVEQVDLVEETADRLAWL